MSATSVTMEICSFAVGCASCGYSVELEPAEAEVAELLWDASHRGPVVWATKMSAEIGTFWVGDRRLLASRGHV